MPVNPHLPTASSARAGQGADQAAGPAAAPTAAPAMQPGGEHCVTCTPPDEHDAWNAAARGETPLQRADRAYGEILQEVRVAQTGVQILFAFLLTLAFTSRFATITGFQKHIYVLTLLLSAAATALLIAPAAFHRMIYRRRLKQHLVQAANRLALSGLVLLLLAMVSALLLILDVVTGLGPALALAAGALSWFITWWFIFPAWKRLRHQDHEDMAGAPSDADSVPAPSGRPPGDSATSRGGLARDKTDDHALFTGPDAAGVTSLPRK
jgi:Family of unknown function (DUF6328)